MRTEKLSKRDVRKLYIQNQKRGVKRLPMSAELLSRDWCKCTISVEDLWKLNPQFYVGYRLGDEKDDDSGYLTYELWRQNHFNSNAHSIITAFRELRDNGLYSDPKIKAQATKINKNFATVPLEKEEYPIFLLNSNGVVPYSNGHTIDGVRRLLSVFSSYLDGDIQGDADVNIVVGNFSEGACLAFNSATALLDTKPVEERSILLEERRLAAEILFSEHID
jgi:hypothetical protein